MGNTFSDESLSPISLSSIQNGSAESALMCQRMAENGFCVIAFDESENDTIENMLKSGSDFMKLDKETKNIYFDPKNENLGYVDIEGTRDFIKLREGGDRQGQFPDQPQNFKASLLSTNTLFSRTCWNIYLELLNNPSISPNSAKHFPEDIRTSLKECVDERASVSYIRYYLPSTPQPAIRDVCDEHTDTGLLTLIMCSSVPGLQIWDRKNQKWSEAEREVIRKYKSANPLRPLAFCIMGEKITTFTDSKVLSPTLHRVMVENGVERSSLLYFMDTAK